MSRVLPAAFVLLVISAFGCSRDVPLAPSTDGSRNAMPTAQVPQIDRTEIDAMEQQALSPAGGLATIGKGRRMVEVPDGSVDALADAIAQAGANGVVLLKSGIHAESGTVKIEVPVTVIGEEGAELVTSAGGLSSAIPLDVVPGVQVAADHVVIRNIAFRPASGDGNTGVLIDGGSHCTLFGNHLSGYQFSLVVASGNFNRIWNNTVVTNSAWQIGAVSDAHGIVLVNGSHGSVMDNDVSNAVFGMWICGPRGELAFNSAHGNYVGIILCKVPQALQLPGGAIIGSELSGQNWAAVENSTTSNLTTGLLVIDGANNNVIADNASSGNGTYDVELTGDTYRFGFLTPASFENTFIAGSYPDIEIKNCGNDNQIIGGALVDNSVEPCD